MMYRNEDEGTCSTVTETSSGFVVHLFDTDANDALVGTRIYDNLKDANRYAMYIVFGFLND